MQFVFGSGTMWAIPVLDLAGNNVAANPTPVQFGGLQDVSIDLTQSQKELYGLRQFPLAVGRGTGKISLKAKSAAITAVLFNLGYGENVAANQALVSYQESGNIQANNVSVAQAANFYADLGVVFQANGTPLTRNSATPAAGEYTVTAGNYAFNAANNTMVYISYAYNSANGYVIVVKNELLGVQPFFKVMVNGRYAGKQAVFEFLMCSSSKLSFATKLEDFMIPEFDFAAQDDGSGNLFKINLRE